MENLKPIVIKEIKMASYLKNGIWTECEDYVDNSWRDDGGGLEEVVFRLGYEKEVSMFDTFEARLEIYQINLISDMPEFLVIFCPFNAIQNIYIDSVRDLICFFKEIKPMMDLILRDEEIKNDWRHEYGNK